MPAQSNYFFILDDHPLVARGLAGFLQGIEPSADVVVEASASAVARRVAQRGAPLLLIADIWLADGCSLDVVPQWRNQYPDTPILVISGDDDPTVPERARRAGAQGFLHKTAPPAQLARVISRLREGQTGFAADPATPLPAPGPAREWAVTPEQLGLTARQGEVLALVLRGLPNKRVADEMGVSESTVKEHLTGILERLGVRSRMEVMALLRGRRITLH